MESESAYSWQNSVFLCMGKPGRVFLSNEIYSCVGYRLKSGGAQSESE